MAITAAELLVKVGWDDSDVEKGSKNTSDKVGRTGDLLKTGAMALGTAAVAGGALAVTSFMNVQDALAPIGTLLGFQSDEYNKYTSNVKDLIASSPQSADELGRGAYDILSAGIMDVDKATLALTESQKLAAAGLGTVPDAVDVITSSMNAFTQENLSGADAAKILFGTMSIGKADLNTIAQGFGGIAPMAAGAGVSFKEMMASVAALTQTGLPASQVYTGLKATLSNVIKPTSEAAEEAKRLGLEFDSSALKTKGLSGFLADIKDKTGGNVDSMGKLFGSVEALNYVMALTGDQAGVFQASIDGVVTSGDGLDAAAKGINNTLSNQFATMKNRSMVALSELATKGFGMLSEFWAKHGDAILATKDKVVNGFKDLFAAFQTGMTQNESATGFERVGLAMRSVVQWAVENWPKLQAAVVTAFNFIREAVQAAIAYWPTFRQAIEPIILSLQNAFETLAPAVAQTLTVIKEIAGEVVAFFQEHWPQIGQVVQEVINTIAPLIEFVATSWAVQLKIIADAWGRWGDDLFTIIGFVFDHLIPIIVGALHIIQGVIKLVTDLIKGDWGAAWDDVKQIFQGAWEIIRGIVTLAWDSLGNILGQALDTAKWVVVHGWDLITGAIGAAVGGISGMFVGMFDGIWDAFRWAINQVIRAWNSLHFGVPGFSAFGHEVGGFDIGVPQLRQLALGGEVTHSGFFDVGERGRERVFLPAGAAVQSNTNLGTGTGQVNVYMAPGSDGDDVVRALRRYQRTNGSVPIRVSG